MTKAFLILLLVQKCTDGIVKVLSVPLVKSTSLMPQGLHQVMEFHQEPGFKAMNCRGLKN